MNSRDKCKFIGSLKATDPIKPITTMQIMLRERELAVIDDYSLRRIDDGNHGD